MTKINENRGVGWHHGDSLSDENFKISHEFHRVYALALQFIIECSTECLLSAKFSVKQIYPEIR